MRNLARQLGTPPLWLPVDTCKEGQKGALAAVCTPTLKSASEKHQKLCTFLSKHREWRSEGGKRNCVLCIFSPSGKQPFSSPMCVASRLEQATRVYYGKICQKFQPTPFQTSKVLFKRLQHLKRLKAHLIMKRSSPLIMRAYLPSSHTLHLATLDVTLLVSRIYPKGLSRVSWALRESDCSPLALVLWP